MVCLLFCLFILTGCSKVEYSLVVTNDNKIQEKIVIPYNNTKKNQKKMFIIFLTITTQHQIQKCWLLLENMELLDTVFIGVL